jgi:hypothetical protein
VKGVKKEKWEWLGDIPSGDEWIKTPINSLNALRMITSFCLSTTHLLIYISFYSLIRYIGYQTINVNRKQLSLSLVVSIYIATMPNTHNVPTYGTRTALATK